MNSRSDFDQRKALEEAARARVRMAEEGSRADSPEPPGVDSEAWRDVQTAWDYLGKHQHEPALAHLVQETLANVPDSRSARLRSRFALPRMAALAALLLVTLGAGLFWAVHSPTTYTTQAAERRQLTLSDGSRVWMDADSAVVVRYTDSQRQLTLLRGQARFEVAHDADRPFTVTAGGRQVTATGTAFNVELIDAGVRVTLLEGHVRIDPVAHGIGAGVDRSEPIRLDPGQELVSLAQRLPRVIDANLERTQAWQDGRIVLDDEPLSSVIERVNRYATRPILIDDRGVADLRVSGVFHTDNVDHLVETLTRYFPLTAEVIQGQTHLRHR